jgi:hypothetical protein
MDTFEGAPLNEIEELGVIAPGGRSADRWLAGFLVVLGLLAAIGFAGRSVEPRPPLFGNPVSGPVEPVGPPVDRGPVRAALVIETPAEGEPIVGDVVTVRGSAVGSVGSIRAVVLVDGREIGSLVTEVGEGSFTLAVPATLPPSASSGYLVVSRGELTLATRRIELRPSPGTAGLLDAGG